MTHHRAAMTILVASCGTAHPHVQQTADARVAFSYRRKRSRRDNLLTTPCVMHHLIVPESLTRRHVTGEPRFLQSLAILLFSCDGSRDEPNVKQSESVPPERWDFIDRLIARRGNGSC